MRSLEMLLIAVFVLLLVGNWLFSMASIVVPLNLIQSASNWGGMGLLFLLLLVVFWSFGD